MSRGGRRRRRPQGKQSQGPDEQGQDQAGPQERAPKPAAAKGADAAPGRRRRRRRGREGRPPGSQDAPARPRRAATLPPDGVVLEEVIASMQSEYGTPTTPQEYRLLVKVGSREVPAEESQQSPAQETEGSRAQAGQAPGAPTRRRTRLRRRSRRPGAKREADEDAPDAGLEAPGPAEA